jgi:hypothetical protein
MSTTRSDGAVLDVPAGDHAGGETGRVASADVEDGSLRVTDLAGRTVSGLAPRVYSTSTVGDTMLADPDRRRALAVFFSLPAVSLWPGPTTATTMSTT